MRERSRPNSIGRAGSAIPGPEARRGRGLPALVSSPAALVLLQGLDGVGAERVARDREVKRLEERRWRIGAKLEILYDNRIVGRISSGMHDRKALECQSILSPRAPDRDDLRKSHMSTGTGESHAGLSGSAQS